MNFEHQHETQRDDQERLIELGWLIVNPLDQAGREAVAQGRALMLEKLREQFPRFEWRMPVMQRAEPLRAQQEEPADLLHQGIEERDIRHWDFVFVITRGDLKSYYKPYALAVPSRAVAVAVLSIARLSPQPPPPDEEKIPLIAKRIRALGLHLFGDLNGVLHRSDPDACMFEPRTAEDLDRMSDYSEEERARLAKALEQVADLRLEERPEAAETRPLLFYGKACWIGARDILSSVIQAKPWEFPFRFGRLTAAALSILMILLMTAEVWELGMTQPPLRVFALSLIALLGTSLFILKRQKLLLSRERRLTEQTVVTNVSISIVVVLGMVTTYLILFGLTLFLGVTFYGERVVEGWAASLQGEIRLRHYLVLAGFVSSLGIIIGSLGASFEGRRYFRHITYADEET